MSLLDNVKGNLIDVTYDDNLLRAKPVETPIATGVKGHFSQANNGKEGDVSGLHERERSSAYRLHTNNRFDVDALIEGGLYFRVTHRKRPETGGWVALATPEQYKVDHVQDVFSNGREKVLFLSRKDK